MEKINFVTFFTANILSKNTIEIVSKLVPNEIFRIAVVYLIQRFSFHLANVIIKFVFFCDYFWFMTLFYSAQ
jgi:hypothetical protein